MTSSVLSRITKEHVTPTPRSHFIFKEGVVWSVGGLSVLLGGLGVAAIIFTVRYSEWEYFDATHDNFLNFLLDIMPYTWIIALILFAVLAYESVRHTKRGYRYHVPVLILGSVGASVALGSVIYAFGAGPFIDRQIGSFIPLHRNLLDTKLAFWNQPDRGIIAGVITEISSTRDEFKLATPSHEIHSIRMDSLPEKVRGTVVVGEAMRVFAKTEVDLILGGHIHDPYVSLSGERYPQVQRQSIISVAGTCLSWRTRSGAPNSFNLIDVEVEEHQQPSLIISRYDLQKDFKFTPILVQSFNRDTVQGWMKT